MIVRDIGAHILPGYGAIGSATAAGSGDNTEVDGAWIDRQDYYSCKVVIGYTTTLTEAKTLTLAANLQDATDSSGTGAADYGVTGESYASAVVATGDTGGSTEVGYISFDVDLQTAEQYIRVQFTPDLSHTSTDTSICCAMVIMGGANTLPAA